MGLQGLDPLSTVPEPEVGGLVERLLEGILHGTHLMEVLHGGRVVGVFTLQGQLQDVQAELAS